MTEHIFNDKNLQNRQYIQTSRESAAPTFGRLVKYAKERNPDRKKEVHHSLNPISRKEAFERAGSGVLLLTVNNRLTRHLFCCYGELQPDAVWETPAIISWKAWLNATATKHFLAGKLERHPITALQTAFLWDEIVETWNDNASTEQSLLRPHAAAASAGQAWDLINEWQLPLQSLRESFKPETRLLCTWIEKFEERCHKRKVATPAELSQLLTASFENGGIAPPAEIILAGFDDVTPAQQLLFDVLTRKGCAIHGLEENADSGNCSLAPCDDSEAEIETAARWAAARLKENPASRIGIVIPDLQQRLEATERILRYHMHPDHLAIDDSDRPVLFNISLGRPLAEEMMVHDALLLLKLVGGKLERHQLSRLLNSRYIAGHGTEWTERAVLDAKLRRHGVLGCRLKELLFFTASREEEKPGDCPQLHRQLQSASALHQGAANMKFHQWAAVFSALLKSGGWPGDNPLNSREYQVREQFRKLLENFGQLNRVAGKLSFEKALGKLSSMAYETPFKQQGSDEPVQVLGILETGGQLFDHLWIAGMQMEQWPSPAHPNPLLPVQLQKEYNLPHSSAERELQFARQSTERLKRSAENIVFSYARRDGESALAPSPLIAELPGVETDKESDRHPLFNRDEVAPTTSLDDAQFAPLKAPVSIRGGTALLRDQAACPFRAAAHHRLKATTPEEPEPGVDPLTRGTLLHNCLERFWRETGDKRSLDALTMEELVRQVDTIVNEMVSEKTAGTGLSDKFIALERQRLHRVISEWLEFESTRPDFRVIACEDDREVDLNGLRVRIRADRVDELNDGTRAIIDYKTGSPFTPGWETERIDEPQLPLYTVTSEEPVSATLLAYVHYGNYRFTGLAESAETVDRKLYYKGDWNQLLQHWKRSLEGLSQEILDGVSVPTPSVEACRYCDLATFCRVNESLSNDGERE